MRAGKRLGGAGRKHSTSQGQETGGAFWADNLFSLSQLICVFISVGDTETDYNQLYRARRRERGGSSGVRRWNR